MTSPYPGNSHWPAHWGKCSLSGSFVQVDGTVISGFLTLTPVPDVIIVPIDDKVVVPEPITIPLVSGSFTRDIPASDDPNITPHGWTYHVEESWDGGRTYDIEAPLGQTVDINRLMPVGSFAGVLIAYGYGGGSGGGGTGSVSSDGFGTLTLTAGGDLSVSSDGNGTLTITGSGVSSDGNGTLVIAG